MPPIRTSVFFLAALALAAAEARTANLVSVRLGELGGLPGGVRADHLVATDTPLAAGAGVMWRYELSTGQWREAGPPQKGATVRGVLAAGSRVWLLLGSAEGGLIGEMVPAPDKAPAMGAVPPPFPVPLRSTQGVVLGNVLYVAGVDSQDGAHWWSLELAKAGSSWRILTPWSEKARSVTTAVAHDGTLILTAPSADVGLDELWRWTPGEGWKRARRLPGEVVPGAARPLGQAHVLYLLRLPAKAGEPRRVQLVTYHTTTSSVATQGAAREGDARLGAGWRNGLVWLDQNAAFRTAEIEGRKQLLRPLDWMMIALYFLFIAGIGAWCYRREQERSAADYFVGSRSIPFWAAGISLYASNSSSIGYIATTAKAYAVNWQYLLGNITNVFALVFVAIWIVPLLRRLELMSVFDYLDRRFHRTVRLAGSGMCILMHLGGRMSIILFLPALAISTVTGLAIEWSVLMMGVVTIAYTALGGIRAVTWTDVAQVVVKFGGLFFAVGYVIWSLKGGTREFVSIALADDKFRMFDWSFDLTKATVWGFIFLQVMETILTFPKDQVLMQRVFSTKSEKEASRSVWIFAAIVLPGSLVLYLMGTGLYVFYQSFPERMNPLLRTDATLPLFIAAELPAGITGLVLAGLFAAAMGTLSSILSSVSTLVSVDFYQSLARKPNQETSIRIAEWVTVIAGVLGICLAILLSRFSIASFLDTAIEFAGLFGGAFGGAYTLGMFTRRANWQGVLIGMGFSFVATFVVWWHQLVHPFLYLGISILFSIVVGYLASFAFPAPPEESVNGLTVFTSRRRAEAPPA